MCQYKETTKMAPVYFPTNKINVSVQESHQITLENGDSLIRYSGVMCLCYYNQTYHFSDTSHPLLTHPHPILYFHANTLYIMYVHHYLRVLTYILLCYVIIITVAETIYRLKLTKIAQNSKGTNLRF